jgi:hypothetical protein
MGLISYLCRVVKRTLLYSIFLAFTWLRFLNLEKSAHEFKDKIFHLTKDCHCAKDLLDKALKDPILAFKVFLGVQVGCAAVAIIGIPILANLCGLVCAVLLTANIFIFELNYPGEGKPIVWKDWQSLVTFESILSAVVVIGILAQVFSCKKSEECCDHSTTTPSAEATTTNTKSTGKRGKAKNGE